jgi:DNA-binding transcriptional ArsR family regulator
VSTLLKALGTPRRRAILRLVWEGERSAGEIHAALGDVTFGAVSQHLRVLLQAGLVEQRSDAGDGRRRLYLARKESTGALRVWLEQMWGTALDELKLRAEMEEARRGPRPKPPARDRRKPRNRSRRTGAPNPVCRVGVATT